MIPILQIKDKDGNWVEIPALGGPQAPAGKAPVKGIDYWTEEDRQKIIDEIEIPFEVVVVETENDFNEYATLQIIIDDKETDYESLIATELAKKT
jgi:hypothetical protein